MNDTIEDDVRAAFARVADPVVPGPDPMGRLLARRRQRTWWRGLGAAAVAVVVATLGGTLAVAPTGGQFRPAPGPDTTIDGQGPEYYPKARMTPWTRRLIDAPTRGNLAGNRELVEEFTADMRDGDHHVDPSQDQVKLLVLADVAGARLAVAAVYNDEFGSLVLNRTPLTRRTDGPNGIGVLGGMTGPLLPFFAQADGVTRGSGPDNFTLDHQATVVLTPAGCTLERSDTTTIGADGTANRTWVPRGDHIVEAGDQATDAWWRVTCDGQVRFEGKRNYSHIGDRKTAETPAPARGTAEPALVGAGVEAWRDATRHLGGTSPGVLWAGPTVDNRPTVVVAGPGRDGRQLVTALTGPPADPAGPGLDRDVRAFVQSAAVYFSGQDPYTGEAWPGADPKRVIEVSYGTATAASTELVAVRLPAPEERPVLGDRILVIAPPSTTELRVNGEPAEPVTDGVGVLTVPPGGAEVVITAADATGAVVATARYREPATTGQYFGERVVDAWE